MALYLQMDGVDDYIKLPSMTLTKIVADVKIRRRTDVARVIWDFRSGIGFSYLQQTTGGLDTWGSGTLKVDNVTKTNNTAAIPNDTRCVIEHTLSSGTDDGNIFNNNSNTANTNISGDIFNLKIYNGTTLLAHYDMTTGTVQDQSGNGRHATLTGGTWLDDGSGGTPVTINAVIANSIADTIVPVVTTQQQVSVSSIIASATADVTIPSVEAILNIGIDVLVATVTAETMAPFVGSSESVQIPAVIASLIVDVITPSVSTSQGSRIDAVIADVTTDALSPTIQTDAIITAIISELQAVGISNTLQVIIGDWTQYNEVISIVLNITRKESVNLELTRKQSAPLDITQRMQSELKL